MRPTDTDHGTDTPRRLAPEPESVRGKCPLCGGPVTSEFIYDETRRYYLILWACWYGKQTGGCDYQRVL